jgi:hypothetical protein
MKTTNMTDAEHGMIASKLQRSISTLRTKRKGMKTLAEKILACNKIKALEQQLFQHRLHYYDLVQE